MQFRVLGPLEVDAGDGPIPLGGPKQRAVLASLLIRANEVVPANTLIDEIWGEDPPEKARNTLQTYVSNLRRSLGNGRLQGRSPGYLLVVDPPELDAARFDALVREAKRSLSVDPAAAVDTFEQALALWRGPALADLSDQEGILPEATRLDELRVEAEGDRIEGLLAAGSSANAIGELESLVARHPLRERLWGLLMLALYREGRQAEALGAYQRARELLADELGVDPSTELSRLQQRVLEHAPDLDLRGEPLRGYRLLETIGEGSFGVVHRALQPHVGREVAVKAITPALANDPDFVRRFEAEAQLVARLEHPHIVPLYDYWRDPDGAYLVMRYLSGGSLRQRLKRDGSLTPEAAAGMLEYICQALATAHRQGVVHRDVKPENVLLDEDGNAYLSDFGIAKDVSDPRATRTGPLGTPAYLSPEQIRGERVTPQTDVYGLGVLLFESLAGAHPFEGGSIASLLERILHEPLPSLGDAAPAGVDEVIARATAKEPALRFPDAISLATAFRAALEPGAVRVAAADAPNPFKGLRPFTEADAGDFFGREALVDRLVARLAEDGDRGRFLGVVGPSGSGKSSAVRAGLVPALRAGALDGSRDWFYVEMAPGAHPLDELGACLLRIAVTEPPDLREALEDEERGLPAAVSTVLPDDGSRLLLVVDQLEEAFTLVEDEGERRRFLERLATVTSEPRVTVVATLRADFYDRPLAHPGFGELLAARTEAVPALTPDELEQAIRAPAEQVGVTAEPGLVAEMVADVAHQPGALPLVQYALTELFERREDDRLTLTSYRGIGGVAGALSARAERIYGEEDEEGRHAIRQVFLRLVTLGEGREDTRRLVTRTELDALDVDPAVLDQVLETFGRHRLLTFDREPATREPTVEIAHEALLGAWDRVRGWIDAAREDLRQERWLTRSVVEWEAADRDPSFLLRGARLEQAEVWAQGTDLGIGSALLVYLRASLNQRAQEHAEEGARRERETRLERRSLRRLRGLVAVFAVAALVAALLTTVATNQSERAEREARIASSRELAAAAVSSIPEDPELAVLLAIESVQMTKVVDGTILAEAKDALHRTIAASRAVVTLPGAGGPVTWGDGVFATADPTQPGAIDIRDGQTGAVLRSISAHTGALVDAYFTDGGALLATTGSDGWLRVWDAATGELEASTRDGGEATGISSSGSLVAAAWPDEKVVRVLDTASGRVAHMFRHPAFHTSLSPDGRSIAVSTGKTVVLDLATGRVEVGPLEQEYGAGNAAWSADGSYLATSGVAGPDIWDATSGEHLFHLPGQPWVDYVEWSSNPTRLVTGGNEAQDIKVWEVGPLGPVELLTLSALETGDGVDGLAISSDGTRVVAAAKGGTTVRVWDVGSMGDAEWMAIPTISSFGDVAFTPDGQSVVAADPTGRIRAWDLVSGLANGPALGPRVEEHTFDLSPDGRSLVTAGNTIIYSTTTGRAVATPALASDLDGVSFGPDGDALVVNDEVEAHGTTIIDLDGTTLALLPDAKGFTTWMARFSPNGRTIATIGDDGPSGSVITIWDWRRQEILRTISTPFAHGLAFDPTGRRVATTWGAVSIWDVRSGAQSTTLQGAGASSHDAEFSPDGSRLAVAGKDGTIRLFDAGSGTQMLVLPGDPAYPVGRLAFSPDGTKLASQGPLSGVVRVWALDIDDLLEIAHANVTRSLTDAECSRYLHVETCPA